MKLGIASDHGGYQLKNELATLLKEEGNEVVDYGTYDEMSTDYPIYAFKLCEGIKSKDVDYGIAICRTGIGMSIACNKVDGIFAAKIDSIKDAELAKNHNGANIITFGSHKTPNESMKMIETFLNTEVSQDERHQRRRNLIKDFENEH